MSKSYYGEERYTCVNDCVQTGCPGHTLQVVSHNSSDTLNVVIDGKPTDLWFDEHLLNAIFRSWKEVGHL